MARETATESRPLHEEDIGSVGIAEEPPSRAGKPDSGSQERLLLASPRAKFILVAVVAAVVAGSLILWRNYAGWESTDDAPIDGHVNSISARVSGQVIKVNVEDNQYVDAGTVLVELDPSDYQVAADRTKAQLADAGAAAKAARAGVPITSVNTSSGITTARADLARVRAGIEAAQKQYQAAEARLREAEANNTKAQADVERYKPLAAKQEISAQQYDQAVAAAKASAATVDAARANVAGTEQQVTQAETRQTQAEAQLRSARTAPQQVAASRARAAAAAASVLAAQAAVERAELNLKYTKIIAPVAGIVGRKTVEVGQNVQPSQALLAIVPTEDIWVTANFKETQLRKMRSGQYVRIHVDAYGRNYAGRVLSIGGATGERFSLLPPENATGNYVKVVQRLPVRITFDQGQDPNHLLRVGMSVEPSVRTK